MPFKTEARESIENFHQYLHDTEGMDIISKLKRNETALMAVAMWMTANGHHKRFKECNARVSDDCVGIGFASKFHGKHCPACVREYRREWYDKEHPEVMKRRKARTTSGKANKPKKPSPTSKRTVTFKKGTKKR